MDLGLRFATLFSDEEGCDEKSHCRLSVSGRLGHSGGSDIIHLAGAADGKEAFIGAGACRDAGLDIVSSENSCGSVHTIDTLQGQSTFIVGSADIEQRTRAKGLVEIGREVAEVYQQ